MQLFTNNATGLLASGITAVATTFSVGAGEGAFFPAITANSTDYCFITLDDGSGNIEIVKVTEHTAASDTFQAVVRAQESTTAFAFPLGSAVEMRLTVGGINDFIKTNLNTVVGTEHNALGSNAIDIQLSRAAVTEVASGSDSIAIGRDNTVAGADNIGIGRGISTGSNLDNIMIGNVVQASTAASANSLSIGAATSVSGLNNVVLGPGSQAGAASYAPNNNNIAIGNSTVVGVTSQAGANVAIGYYAGVGGGNRSIVIGNNVFSPFGWTGDQGVAIIAATQAVHVGDSNLVGGNNDRIDHSAAQSIIMSPIVDLTAIGSFDITPVFQTPGAGVGGMSFYVDEIGIVLSNAPGAPGPPKTQPSVSTLPTITFGFGSAGAQLLGATAVTGLASLLDRQVFTPLTPNGTRSLGFDITIAGTAGGTGALHGRFYFKGFAALDN